MGQDEDPEPLVRRADFCRREQTRRRRIAHAPKLSKDGFKAERDMTGDVFEENPFGAALGNDTGNLGPQVAGVGGSGAFARGAEGLAGISGQDDVEGTAEGPGIEAAQIIPDWRGCKVSGELGGDEDGAGPIFPFNEGAGVIAGFGEHEAQIQASATCAEGQSVLGT